MTDQDKMHFWSAMMQMYQSYGRTLTQEVARAYWYDLCHLTLEAVVWGIGRAKSECCDWPPSCSRVLAHAKSRQHTLDMMPRQDLGLVALPAHDAAADAHMEGPYSELARQWAKSPPRQGDGRRTAMDIIDAVTRQRGMTG